MLGKDLSWIEIDKSKITSNLNLLKSLAGANVTISPCLKSNAYGHGLFTMAEFLSTLEVKNVCVDSLEEFLVLKNLGLNVLIMGYVQKHEIEEAIIGGAKLLIYEIEIAKQLSKIAQKLNRKLSIHIKIDTGMSRQGVDHQRAIEFLREVEALPGIKIEGIATHYAISDELGNPDFFKIQLQRFLGLRQLLNSNEIFIPLWHSANSAAVLASQETHFNFIRPGFALYGGYPSSSVRDFCLKNNFILEPALTFKTKIAAIKTLPPNTFISYGCTYRTSQKTKIAILPVGYNDGINRKLSNCGKFLVRGKSVPILGNVCMNITIIDVSEIEELNLEDEVILMSGDKDLREISMYDHAVKSQTIPYEILTNLREGIPRYYL